MKVSLVQYSLNTLEGALITTCVGIVVAVATTQLGVWLIRDLHGVSETVSDLTRSSLVYMCGYPLFDAVVSPPTIMERHTYCVHVYTVMVSWRLAATNPCQRSRRSCSPG